MLRLLPSVRVQLAGKRFKCGDVAADNGFRAIEAVAVPASAIADVKPLVATLDAVPGVGLAVVSLLGYVHLGADAQ